MRPLPDRKKGKRKSPPHPARDPRDVRCPDRTFRLPAGRAIPATLALDKSPLVSYTPAMDMQTTLPADHDVRYPYQEGRAIAKVRYSHDAMIDMIIAEPWVSQNRLAEVFGYTPAWVSLVMSSDAFKERLAARKAEVVDPTLTATLEERFKALVTRSVEVLQEKLAAPASVVPDQLALRAMELGAKSLGLGQPQQAPVAPPMPDRLNQLAQRLVALQVNVTQGGESPVSVTVEGAA